MTKMYTLYYFLYRALTFLIECVGTDEIVRCSVHNHLPVCNAVIVLWIPFCVFSTLNLCIKMWSMSVFCFLLQPLVRPLIPKVVAFINQILAIDEVGDCSLLVNRYLYLTSQRTILEHTEIWNICTCWNISTHVQLLTHFLRSLVRCKVVQEKRYPISTNLDVLFCILYRHTDNDHFDNFQKIFNHFPKISKDSKKFLRFLKITKDF